jgi:hypothetical protein
VFERAADAQLAVAAQAVATAPTAQERVDRHAVADLEVVALRHRRADLLDDAHRLVASDHGKHHQRGAV